MILNSTHKRREYHEFSTVNYSTRSNVIRLLVFFFSDQSIRGGNTWPDGSDPRGEVGKDHSFMDGDMPREADHGKGI